jgi:hypothetical protein
MNALRSSAEEISRYRGAYLASYAIPVAAGFIGYCKVATEEPVSVWETEDVQLKVASKTYPDARDAMLAARTKAQRLLDQLSTDSGRDFMATRPGHQIKLARLLHPPGDSRPYSR